MTMKTRKQRELRMIDLLEAMLRVLAEPDDEKRRRIAQEALTDGNN